MSASALFKKLLIIPGIALGVFVLFFLVKSRQEPPRSEIQEVARSVRIIGVPEIEIVPRALGYGIVQAGQTWEAVAEVAGKVVEIHPQLKKGALLREGDVLLRIDPAEYGLAKIRAQAEIENLEAQLNELKQNEQDIRRSLDVEKRSLGISRQELERRQRLFAKGTISKSALEQEEKRILVQQNAVQNLQTTLNRLPSQRKAIQAKIASSQANLEGTGLDIQKTTIQVPFDCRISESNVELAQFVSIGKVLLKADNIGFVEILAQTPLNAFKRLFEPRSLPGVAGRVNLEQLKNLLQERAWVRFHFGDTVVQWEGRFVRVSEMLDPQTRTVGVYVVVDEPYQKIRPGERPPLVKNMYCEVEMSGHPRNKSLIIPRAALRPENTVYLASRDSRLERKKVEVDYVQGNVVSVKDGLAAGDRVIVSDIVPAIDGMLLKPENDTTLLAALIAEAVGEVPLK